MSDGSGSGATGTSLWINVVSFGRLLRRLGLKIGPGHTRLFMEALEQVPLASRADVMAAGRAVYAGNRDEIALYDAAFESFWRRATAVGSVSDRLPRIRQQARRYSGTRGSLDGIHPAEASRVVLAESASDRETLRTADFADLTPEELRDAEEMLADLRPALATRLSRRRRLARRGGRLAMRYLMRRSMSTGGEPLTWRWLRRVSRPRPIVMVADISGSMERYSRLLLRFGHTLARSGAALEVFVFGTRLTRITRELRTRDADLALRLVAARVVDWDGGTRIGESLHTLNRRWVRRTVRSGAVVLVASDGWERGDPEQLGREVATLRRSCHRLIWLDPLASRPHFRPATEGLKAALPHVDAFLPCASVSSLHDLARGLADMEFANALPQTDWAADA